MASSTDETSCSSSVLPPVESLPTDGFGGTYYLLQFPVPIYTNDSQTTLRTISWADIDDFYHYNAVSAVECAVCFGICVVTLLNIIALTPREKRRTPLHTLICLALGFQIIRNGIDMCLMTKSVTVSAYYNLTFDWEAIVLSRSFFAMTCVSQLSACLSFVFVQACLLIKGKAMMTWLQIHHRRVYLTILICFVLCGCVTIALRLGLAIWLVSHSFDINVSSYYNIFRQGSVIGYAVSICCWSLVFFVSAVSIIVNRRKLVFDRHSTYDRALNLIALIGIESFIIPMILCILQLVPDAWLRKPEQLIIPSVLFLLPMGSLFVTGYHNRVASGEDGCSIPMKNEPIPYQNKNFGNRIKKLGRGLNSGSARNADSGFLKDSDPGVLQLPAARSVNTKDKRDAVEIELAFIDALDTRRTEDGRDIGIAKPSQQFGNGTH